MTIGNYIRERRLDLGILQKELAEKCDVSVQTINTIEKDKSTPSVTTLRRIAQQLNVDYFVLRRILKEGVVYNGKDHQGSTQ
jgi:transcriptional regulator with XRE-family HTH domain